MRSSAAVAVSSVVAATAATGSPMNRTFSTQSACSSCETGRIPNGIGRSRPVSTAITPSSFVAADVSIETMRAWGCVLRSSLQKSMRGNARSSAKRVAPVTFATASTFRSALPMILCTLHPVGGELDRFVDLEVAGAATEVSRQGFLDLVSARLRVSCEQRFGGKQKCRSTVAALRSAEIGERLLERMELAALCHAFDGPHASAVAGESQHEAREHGRFIEQHGAGPAFAELPAVLCAGRAEILPEPRE